VEEAVIQAAARLRAAEAERKPCAPVRDLIGSTSIDAAYNVQRANTELGLAEGRRIAGWKTGLTAKSVQQQFGVDQPDFGVLFADTAYGDAQPIPLDELLQPRVEAEVAFVFEADLPEEQITTADVLRLTAYVVPAIEVVDSRVLDWDITIVDTIADNASSGRYVLGGHPTRLHNVDLRRVVMEMRLESTVVSRGSGAACLDHPVNAVVWLANTLARRGTRIRAGDTVLSGALGPLVPVGDGPSVYEARLEGLGTVRAPFVTSASS
jgi:2-keto-4-pentenoate hydratase